MPLRCSIERVTLIGNNLSVGTVQIKPDGQLLGNLHRHPHIKVHDPISMGFDETGMRLILVDHKVWPFCEYI